MSVIVRPGEKLSVLVVDDEQEVRQSLREFLDSMQCWDFIVEAQDGLEALGKVQNQKFDLIVADFKMPKLNGLQFVKHLRAGAQEKSELTPVIFCSGNLTTEAFHQALSHRVKYFLAKPFNGEKFIAKIEEILAKEKKHKLKCFVKKVA